MPVDTEPPGSDRTFVPALRLEGVALNPAVKEFEDRAPDVILDCEPPKSESTKVQRKKPVSREWMRFDSSGVCEFLELDRNAILRRASIPARDLRILNPEFSDFSHILARESAIVVHLEFIRAIITTNELFLLDATDPNVVEFVQQLKEAFPLKPSSQEDQQDSVSKRSTSILPCLHPEPDQQDSVNIIISEVPALDALVVWSSEGNSLKQLPYSQTPFELRVLEIALDVVCKVLEGRVNKLERKVYPTLDEFTRHITSKNLELLRILKSELTRHTSKVHRVRDELEQILDDDDDMEGLCLTRKLADQRVASPSISFRVNGAHPRPSRGNEDVEMLEMILDAYFMQLEGTLKKLEALREYMDNTEDYIKIQLDYQRNQLLEFQMTLTIWHLAMGIGACMLGLVSMNIKFPLDFNTHAFIPFVMGVLTVIAGLFSIGVMYLYWKGLFQT